MGVSSGYTVLFATMSLRCRLWVLAGLAAFATAPCAQPAQAWGREMPPSELCSRRAHGAGGALVSRQETQGLVLAPPPAHCVTWGKQLTLSGPLN